MPFTLRTSKRDLEDMGSKFGGAPDLEFRAATKALELEASGLTYQRVPPGYRFPYGHTHETQEEVYVVVRGSERMKVDDEISSSKNGTRCASARYVARLRGRAGGPRDPRHRRAQSRRIRATTSKASATGGLTSSPAPGFGKPPHGAVSSRPVSSRKKNSERATIVWRCSTGVAWRENSVLRIARSQRCRLEVEELDARDHQVGVRIRGVGGEERNGLAGKGFRVAPAPSRRRRPHGDRDGRINVVRGNGYLLLCPAATGPTASSKQNGTYEPSCRRSPHCRNRRRRHAGAAVRLRGCRGRPLTRAGQARPTRKREITIPAAIPMPPMIWTRVIVSPRRSQARRAAPNGWMLGSTRTWRRRPGRRP